MINAIKRLLVKSHNTAINGYLLGKMKSGKDMIQTLEEAKKHTLVTYDDWPESQVAVMKVCANRVNQFLDAKEPVLVVNVGIADEDKIFKNTLTKNNFEKIVLIKVNSALDAAVTPGSYKSLTAATKDIKVALNNARCVIITHANPVSKDENEKLIHDFKELSKELLESAMKGELRKAKIKDGAGNESLSVGSASLHFELMGAGSHLGSSPVYVFPQARSVSATVTYYEKLAEVQNLSPATLANIFTFLKVEHVIDDAAPRASRDEPFVLSYIPPADLVKKIAA